MTRLVAAAWVALATLLQLAIIASGPAVADLRSLPLLPLAALAAWAAARGPDEAWTGLLPAPLLLGLASDERAAWFLLALTPTPLLAAALRGRGRGEARAAKLGALAASGGAAFAGVLAYMLLFALLAGDAGAVLDEPGALARGALLTSLLAAVLAGALLVPRPRRRGLFG